jgi:ankyrin repeat protein
MSPGSLETLVKIQSMYFSSSNLAAKAKHPNPLSLETSNGDTPLHWAAYSNEAAVVKHVAESHPPALAVHNKQGFSPLDVALRYNRGRGDYVTTVRILRELTVLYSRTLCVTLLLCLQRASTAAPSQKKKKQKTAKASAGGGANKTSEELSDKLAVRLFVVQKHVWKTILKYV